MDSKKTVSHMVTQCRIYSSLQQQLADTSRRNMLTQLITTSQRVLEFLLNYWFENVLVWMIPCKLSDCFKISINFVQWFIVCYIITANLNAVWGYKTIFLLLNPGVWNFKKSRHEIKTSKQKNNDKTQNRLNCLGSIEGTQSI